MKGIIETIHGKWSGTKIILLGILPRGTDYWDGGSGRTSWPNVLTPAINSLNENLKVRCDVSQPMLSSCALYDVGAALEVAGHEYGAITAYPAPLNCVFRLDACVTLLSSLVWKLT